MRIKSIRLKNFLCYYGDDNHLHLSDGLNLVLGENGYGKSKLYDSFFWVIRDHISGEGLGAGIKGTTSVKKGLISEKALHEAGVGERVECYVCIVVEDGVSRTKEYKIERSYSVTKRGEDDFAESSSSNLTVYKLDVLDHKPLSDIDAKAAMQSLFPDDVLPYMWFQGERGVENLVDVSRPEKLKTIINKLSDVSRWDEYIEVSKKAYETVDKSYTAQLKLINTSAGKLAELSDALSNRASTLRRKEDDLRAAKESFANANTRSDEVIGKQANAEQVKRLQQQKEAFERELKAINKALDDLEISKPRKQFTESWLLEGTDSLFERFERKYQEYSKLVIERKMIAQHARSEKGGSRILLLPGIPEPVHIHRMLEEEICLVCGREAKVGSPAYEEIKKRLPTQGVEVKDSSIEPELRKLLNSSMIQLDKAKRAPDGRKADTQKTEELYNDKNRIQDEIRTLEGLIGTQVVAGEDPDFILSKYQNAQADIAKFASQITRYEYEIENLGKEVKDLENKRRELSKGQVEPALETKHDHFKLLAEASVRLRNARYSQLIDQLEAEANIHYKKMNEGTGAVFGRLKFVRNSNDGVTPVITDDRDIRMDNVNTSQMTSMKLAIILAIITANKTRDDATHYPLISDAPISDFGLVKSKSFLLDTAETFNQSIVILKDFLEEDAERPRRFRPKMSDLRAIKDSIAEAGKKLSVFQLDLADGLDTNHRRTLAVRIKNVAI